MNLLMKETLILMVERSYGMEILKILLVEP
jgi:hypothetical protein